METCPDIAPKPPLHVVHFASTGLAVAEIEAEMQQPDVAFMRVGNFDALLAQVEQTDLILLTDPGLAQAERLAAVLDAIAPRPVALHILSAGREGFARWSPPAHVHVSGAGSALAQTVAEHALALILCLFRELQRFDAARAWLSDGAPRLRSLDGARLLIVGGGHIGQQVARRARPFGPRIIGLNRSEIVSSVFDETGPLSALNAALPRADIVVLCLPLTDETRCLIGRDQLRLMRKDVILINVGRGGLVDEDALAAALGAGDLGGAGLDVFATEPLASDSPLWSTPNTILTPHIAGLGGLGEQRIAETARQALDLVRSRRSGKG